MARDDWEKPLRQIDAAFLAANISLALRQLRIAMNAMKSGNDDTFNEYMGKVGEQSDKLWALYQSIVDDPSDEEGEDNG